MEVWWKGWAGIRIWHLLLQGSAKAQPISPWVCHRFSPSLAWCSETEGRSSGGIHRMAHVAPSCFDQGPTASSSVSGWQNVDTGKRGAEPSNSPIIKSPSKFIPKGKGSFQRAPCWRWRTIWWSRWLPLNGTPVKPQPIMSGGVRVLKLEEEP